MIRLVLAAVIGTMALLAFSGLAATARGALPAANASFCATNPSAILSAAKVPAGGVLIVNVKLKVSNDEDSGFIGYWAIDNYTKSIKIYQVTPSSFYAIVTYNGTWSTYKSALSPQSGTYEFLRGHGPFSGGYNLTFTGTFSPSKPTTGNLGNFNYGGTPGDVLLGSYSNGQTGAPGPFFDWTSAYFTGFSSGTEYWGWAYNWTPGAQTWCNEDSTDGGSAGDIVT